MIKIRVLHTDGRDEVYDDVVKTVVAFNELGNQGLMIYTTTQNFKVDLTETVFVQHWEEDAE
jgi:hypothetical protein